MDRLGANTDRKMSLEGEGELPENLGWTMVGKLVLCCGWGRGETCKRR